MNRAVLGFIVIGIAILMMLSRTLFGVESDLPFILGLWVGVVGLALINSSSRDEDRKRRKIYEQRLQEKKAKLAENNRNESEQKL